MGFSRKLYLWLFSGFERVGKTVFLFLLTFLSRGTYVRISSLRNPFERLDCVFFPSFLDPVSEDSVLSQEEPSEEDKMVSVLPNTESWVSFLSLVFILK